MINGILAIVTVTIIQRMKLGNFVLIEKCSSPWETYTVDGTIGGFYESNVCRRKCQGKAFHTNDGKLICFYKKDIAQRLANPPSGTRQNKSTIEKCDCGYKLKKYRKNWMFCNISIPDTTKNLCDGICEEMSVYLFKRRNKGQIVYCEQNTREGFYEMDGEIGEILLRHRNNLDSKYRICSCGISNTHLKHYKQSSDDDIFEECADPWKVTKYFDVKKVDKCARRCHKRCHGGFGFYYKEKPLCFHHSMPLVRRSLLNGGSEGICECGHGKTTHKVNSKIVFTTCDPPIVRNDLKPYACKKYCSQLLAYICRSSVGSQKIQCVSDIDPTSLKPEPLSGKCDVNVHSEENEKPYMICRCGLRKKHKSEFPCNRTDVEEMGIIELPDAWSVKKERSKRSYQKSHIIPS